MTTIADIAAAIAYHLDIDQGAALTLATTYAAQLDYPVPEGGQAPDVEVTAEDAGHILSAAGVAQAAAAASVLDDIVDAVGAIEAATVERDRLIRRAIADGVPRAAIASAAGLSRARVYQIRDGR